MNEGAKTCLNKRNFPLITSAKETKLLSLVRAMNALCAGLQRPLFKRNTEGFGPHRRIL